MKKFIICRQYLVPLTNTIAVEADSIEEACREALGDQNDKHDWGNGNLDWEGAFNHSIVEAMEISNDATWEDVRMSQSRMERTLGHGVYVQDGVEIDASESIIDVDVPDEFSDKCQWDYMNDRPYVKA